MASSQRPGEITYYEELGIEDTASGDEIRDAFRSLARLLHPDQQTDLLLKDTAERQMRKLNRIHAVLSDSGRRHAYDASLAARRNAPIIVLQGSDAHLKKLLTRGAVISVVLLGSFLLIWFMVTSNGQEARGVSAAKAGDLPYADAGGDAGDQISRLRDQLRAAETERDAALAQLGRTGSGQTGRTPTGKGPLDKGTLTAQLPAPASMNGPPSITGKVPVASPSALPTVSVNQAAFTGSWVYSKADGSASAGGKSFPPEFIELTVTSQNGSLQGHYRSRYQMQDQAMSPEVNFDFMGTPVGSSLHCAWRGPGGARGRMTLKLLPSSTAEIAWNATDLGTQQWLVSETATLNRR